MDHSHLSRYKGKPPTRRRRKSSNNSQDCDSRFISDIGSVRSDCTFDMNERGVCLNTDCDSEPDRSNPTWKVFQEEQVSEEPKEQKTDDDEKKPTLWEEIMLEYHDKMFQFDSMRELEKPFEPTLPVLPKLSAFQYLDKYIFPLLCPVLEETLHKAKEWDCLRIQKCRFSGLDYISELLWNRNPRYPRRRRKHRGIFDIPFVIIWLYYNPRPIYPLSWLWTKEEAIIVLQGYIRRYLVCKEAECSEMRQFWKVLKKERDEKNQLLMEQYIEELDEMFNDMLDTLVANAVFNSEWKKYGCRCKPNVCHCVCHCQLWCKCCTCYKVTVVEGSPCTCDLHMKKKSGALVR